MALNVISGFSIDAELETCNMDNNTVTNMMAQYDNLIEKSQALLFQCFTWSPLGCGYSFNSDRLK